MGNNLTKDFNFYANYYGQAGHDVMGAADTVNSHTYVQIWAQQDATVTYTSEVGDSGTSVALNAGSSIYGRFSSVTCVSGKLIVYREYVD